MVASLPSPLAMHAKHILLKYNFGGSLSKLIVTFL